VDRILDRVTQGAAPVIALIAPAGFGKTRLAKAYAARFARQASVVMDGEIGALQAVSALLGTDVSSVDTGCQRLWDSEAATCVVVDSIERSEDDVALELLGALIRSRPDSGVIVFCSRREPLHFQFSDLVGPHLLAVFRRVDLEFSIDDLKRMIPSGANVPMAAIYGIYALTRGWPVPTMSLMAASARGAFEAGVRHDHPALNDLLDWVDKNAIQVLPHEVQEVLIHCVACRDSVPSDFDRFGKGPLRADTRLYRNSQRADIGFAGEIRVHPLLAFTLRARHAAELERCAHEASARFIEQNELLRAARALISVGDLKNAADIVDDMGFDVARDLAGFAYPGLALEHHQRTKPPFERYPLLWLNLVPCRSYVVPANTLAREGVTILRGHTDRLEPRLVRWLTAITAVLFVESGDLESAERYANLLRGDGSVEESVESLDIIEMYLDIAYGRYSSALQRWQRLDAYLRSTPVWHDLHLRCSVRAEARLGNLDAGIDALRAQLSSIRMGGCPSLAGFGAMEAAWLSWYRGDEADFRRFRREFASIAQHYDIPRLWRSLCALFGEDLDDGTTPIEHHDVLSALILAADDPDADRGRALAVRAVVTADRGRDPALKIVARVVAAARDVPNAASLLEEAETLADAMDSQPMKDSLKAYKAGKADIGYLQQHIDHVRRATCSDTTASKVSSDALTIDVATAAISRGEQTVRVSEGAAQLLILLAVNGTTSRDAILDRMWPDLDGDAAANALKMCIHRARLQLGDPKAIAVHKGTYALGDQIESNYRYILDCAAKISLPLTREQKSEFEDVFDRLTRGFAAGRASWPWFQPFASALQDAMRRLGEYLAEEELERGDPQIALQLARRLASVDPFDETARALVIRAYGKTGNWAAAIHEFREFSDAMKRDMGAEPSERLKRLLNAC
jgi:DNA-binding SARP family transcriptional activator